MRIAEQQASCCRRPASTGKVGRWCAWASRRVVAISLALAAIRCARGAITPEHGTIWSDDWIDEGGNTSYALGASSPGPTRLDVWLTGADGKLYLRSESVAGAPASGFQVASALPGGASIAGPPSAVFSGNDTTDLLVRGSDGALWTGAWTNTSNPGAPSWKAWTTLGPGGVTARDAAITALPARARLDVWALTTDGAVAHVARVGGAWSASWTTLPAPPGKVPVGIAAVARPDVTIDLVVTASDGSIWHGLWDDARARLSWEDVSAGAIAFGRPSVSAPSLSQLDVWIVAADDAIYTRSWSAPEGTWGVWTYVGGPTKGLGSGPGSGPTALYRSADPRNGTDVVVRGVTSEAEHRLWYGSSVDALAAPPATASASLILLEADGTRAAPLWESVALAVPPSAACPNGTLIVAGSREGVAPGDGTARVWTAELNAVAGGGNVPMRLVTLPSTGDPGDYLSEADDVISLLPDGTALLDVHTGHSDTVPAPPFTNPRGVELLYASSDCGANWAFKGRIDPANPTYANSAYAALGDWGDVWPRTGDDRPELYVDPWPDSSGRVRVYFTVDACGQPVPGTPPESNPATTNELLYYGLWDPVSQTFAPQPCSVPGAPFCLVTQGSPPLSPMGFAPDTAMTSLPDGTLYMFSCEGTDAIMYSFRADASGAVLSPKMIVNSHAADGTPCALATTGRPLDGSLSISRVGSYSEGDLLRVVWPGVADGPRRQVLNIAYVMVSGGALTVTSRTQLGAGAPGGSLVQAAVAEVSAAATTLAGGYGVSSPPADMLNTALIYYYATTTTPDDGADGGGWGNTSPTMALLRDESVSAASRLGGDFAGFSLPGDYQHGSAYFDMTTNKVTCVALWTDTSALVLHANVVTTDP
jgi:hypothetical protein